MRARQEPAERGSAGSLARGFAARLQLDPLKGQAAGIVEGLLGDLGEGDRLAAEPQHDYTMTALAGLAAMSPSSLRSKFKAVYGQTVFEFLKARRLELARGYLEQGYSVQQAAHFTGYRHATNLTAAFRRRYGLPPSQLVRR